jgi:death-on-curing protein
MKLLTLEQVLILHKRIIEQSGGSIGIRDKGILESALAQPYMSYGGQELYPTLIKKVAALGFSLINNHPFVDGNKPIGHAAIVRSHY